MWKAETPAAQGKDNFPALEGRLELEEGAGNYDAVQDVLEWLHTGREEHQKSKTETRVLFKINDQQSEKSVLPLPSQQTL